MKNSINYLVIGAGNILLSDEGLGVHIVRQLKKDNSKRNLNKSNNLNKGSNLNKSKDYRKNGDKNNKIIEKADFIDIGTSSLDICSYVNKNIKKIVIIDCIKTGSYPPGTVFKLTPDELMDNYRNSNYSLHQMQLLDSLKINSLLEKLPEVLILAVVPFDVSTFSTELSEKIKKEFPVILKKVSSEIINFFKK
jgi:hydrogenase maturation protease